MACLDVIRVILATINVLVNGLGALYGLALIAQGVACLILFNVIEVFSDSEHLVLYNIVFFIAIAIGVVLLLFSVVAITGSCLACCPINRCLKMTAALILAVDLIAVILVFLLGIACVILIFQYRDAIATELVPILNKALNESYTLSPTKAHASIVALQEALGCCGISSPADFATYPDYPYGDILPDSCCDADTFICTVDTAQDGIGCGTYVANAIVEYSNVIGGISIGQVVIIFLLILLEIFLIGLVIGKENDELFAKV